jgi:hypothetical protein
MHCPPVAPPSGWQMVDGKQTQFGVPAHAGGRVVQNGGGGVQGGGTQPGTVPTLGGHCGS